MAYVDVAVSIAVAKLPGRIEITCMDDGVIGKNKIVLMQALCRVIDNVSGHRVGEYIGAFG